MLYSIINQATVNNRTAGDDDVEEARPLLVGADVKVKAGRRRLDLGGGVESAAPQAAGVALHLGGQHEDVARLKVALLQTQYTLPARGQPQGYSSYPLLWQN